MNTNISNDISYEALAKLQNGSDIRGVSLTGVGGTGEAPNLTEAQAEVIAKGFLAWLSGRSGKKAADLKIAIGRDPRLSGQMLLHGLCLGFGPYGANVLDCGLASTPAMFMANIFPEFACDGSIMITASHLPYNRNGFKFFTPEGGLNKEDIKEILKLAADPEAVEAAIGPATNEAAMTKVLGKKSYVPEDADIMTPYCEMLKDIIIEGVDLKADAECCSAEEYAACCGNDTGDTGNSAGTASANAADACADREHPLKGLKIAVDAGNGGGGFYAKRVLAPLGADISSSQFLEPDGTFPNHMPNPENKEAMTSISLQVISTQSDFGIIFDTDVDRSSAVDGKGREIARNGIVAMAAALVAEKHPGTIVVTDSITSDGLTDFIEGHLGMKHLRFKRGYRNVINKAIEINEAAEANGGTDPNMVPGLNRKTIAEEARDAGKSDTLSYLAIETSGHAAFKDNYFLDDGAYLATLIVIKAAQLARKGKTIDSMIADLKEPAEAREVRFPLTCDDFAKRGDEILADLKAKAAGASDGKDAGISGSESTGTSGMEGVTIVEPNYEGVRLAFDKEHGDGWCLLRKSLHDPLMPLNLESNTKGGIAIIAAQLKEMLGDPEGLDISAL